MCNDRHPQGPLAQPTQSCSVPEALRSSRHRNQKSDSRTLVVASVHRAGEAVMLCRTQTHRLHSTIRSSASSCKRHVDDCAAVAQVSRHVCSVKVVSSKSHLMSPALRRGPKRPWQASLLIWPIWRQSQYLSTSLSANRQTGQAAHPSLQQISCMKACFSMLRALWPSKQ